MTKLVSRATPGRVGLVVAAVALGVTAGGAAVGLPGKNKVDSGDIKNNQVSSADLKMAYLRISSTGGLTDSKGIVGSEYAAPNTLCLNLKFVPKTGSATRTIDSGGDLTAPQIGIGKMTLGLPCPVGFRDAVVQVPGQPDIDGTYAFFLG